MTIETAIRERHAFEDRVRIFLELASVMTDREIEIALARLVDMLNEDRNEASRTNISLKGELLKAYFDLRRQGSKPQRKIKRTLQLIPADPQLCLPVRKANLWGRENWSAYLIRCTTEMILFHTSQIPPSASPSPPSPTDIVKLLAP